MVLGAASETALQLGDHSVRLYGQHLVKVHHTSPSWVTYFLGSSEGRQTMPWKEEVLSSHPRSVSLAGQEGWKVVGGVG